MSKSTGSPKPGGLSARKLKSLGEQVSAARAIERREYILLQQKASPVKPKPKQQEEISDGEPTPAEKILANRERLREQRRNQQLAATEEIPYVDAEQFAEEEVQWVSPEIPTKNKKKIPTGVWIVSVVGLIVILGALIVGMFPQNPTPTLVYSMQVGGSELRANSWVKTTNPIPITTHIPFHPGAYSVLGSPTLTIDFINKVLAYYNSPAHDLGWAFDKYSRQYGIDDVYALAFFMHESGLGTTGEARVTLSIGNSRCIPTRACIDQDRGGYAQMNSWVDGIEQWFKLIRNLYIAQWGRVTVDQIIPKYAPNSDGNNEAEYIATIKRTVDTWRSGRVQV